MLNRNAETGLGEVENNSFIAGQAKGATAGVCVCVSLPRLPGGVERSLADFREQGMIPERVDSCWIGWHQDETSSTINLLVSTSLGSRFLWSVIFIWKEGVCFM